MESPPSSKKLSVDADLGRAAARRRQISARACSIGVRGATVVGARPGRRAGERPAVDLAGRRAGQTGERDDLGRHHVVGQGAPQPLAQLAAEPVGGRAAVAT